MNGLENISAKILADAAQQADTVLAAARQEADALLATESARAKRDADALLAEGEAKCADILKKAQLADQLAERQMTAATRQALIGQAFDDALAALLALPDDQYRALLLKLATEALADGEGGELLLNARDRAAHGEALVAALNGDRLGGAAAQAKTAAKSMLETALKGELPSLRPIGRAVSSLGGLITLATDTAPIVGGLVIRRGKVELNCALDVIVRMLSESVSIEVSEALFPKGE